MPEKSGGGGQRRAVLRADARRSIERIVCAAEQLVAHRGSEVTLDEVAREAGVASGTLYRHFPSRMHLFEHLYRDRIARLAESATRLAIDLGPVVGMAQWLRDFVQLGIEARGVLSSLLEQGVRETDREVNFQWGYAVLVDAAAVLIGENQGAGSIRLDINADELVTLVSGIIRALDVSPMAASLEDRNRIADRLLNVVIDGLVVTASARVSVDLPNT